MFKILFLIFLSGTSFFVSTAQAGMTRQEYAITVFVNYANNKKMSVLLKDLEKSFGRDQVAELLQMPDIQVNKVMKITGKNNRIFFNSKNHLTFNSDSSFVFNGVRLKFNSDRTLIENYKNIEAQLASNPMGSFFWLKQAYAAPEKFTMGVLYSMYVLVDFAKTLGAELGITAVGVSSVSAGVLAVGGGLVFVGNLTYESFQHGKVECTTDKLGFKYRTLKMKNLIWASSKSEVLDLNSASGILGNDVTECNQTTAKELSDRLAIMFASQSKEKGITSPLPASASP